MTKSHKISHIVTQAAFILVILIMIAASALAENHDRLFDYDQDDPNEPWHIAADKITYNDQTKQYTANGNVVITKTGKKLTADSVRFDHKAKKLYAQGNVVLNAGEDILTGCSMELDIEAETGTVYDGAIFICENHFYIKGNTIQKVGISTYTIDRASISTCDGDQPDWKLTGSNLKVTTEGYGFINHAALWAKKMPVLYTPFLVFPVKIKRQSGLLPPQIGYSDRKGEEYIQPFYWAINESSDATFYEHHLGRRGNKIGLEYRYVLDNVSKGTVMFDFLNDRKVDDGSQLAVDWGYADDNVPRPNADRYWFRMKHDQALSHGFFAKLDLDIVSDQDYLHEFEDGYTGFDNTDTYFNKNFGRDLDEDDDPIRVNRLNLNRIWPKYSLNAEVRWYDNVINRRQSETDTTFQKLPFIEFDASKQQIRTFPLYFDLDSEYAYFYSEDGSRGHRADAHPRVYLPLTCKNYFTFEPSLGWRETVWHFDKDEYRSSDKKTLSREIYDVKLDLTSEIYKVYPGLGKTDRIKHTINPQIVYDYIPNRDQDKYPVFDSLDSSDPYLVPPLHLRDQDKDPMLYSLDRIDKKNLITYSLTNTFTLKSQIPAEKNGVLPEDKKNEPVSYAYNEFCRFKLEQSYDINEAQEDNPANRTDKNQKMPFSPIYGEIELWPGRYLSLEADATRSFYESFYRSHNIAMSISDNRGDELFVEYRYQHNFSESIYTDLSLKISDRLTAYTVHERNLYDGKDITKGFGFFYEKQCWALDFFYQEDDNESKYAFIVYLYGLGKLGPETKGRNIEDPFKNGK